MQYESAIDIRALRLDVRYLLPVMAILFEIFTGFCWQFIDPMPTLWHVAVLGSLPVCN